MVIVVPHLSSFEVNYYDRLHKIIDTPELKEKLEFDRKYHEKINSAANDLYEIRQSILPEKLHPDMEWAEAAELIAKDGENIRTRLKQFLVTYYSYLPADVVGYIESADIQAGESKFYQGEADNWRHGDRMYADLTVACTHLKAYLDNKQPADLRNPFHEEKVG